MSILPRQYIGDSPTLTESWIGACGELLTIRLTVTSNFSGTTAKALTHKNTLINIFQPSLSQLHTFLHFPALTNNFICVSADNTPTLSPVNDYRLYSYGNLTGVAEVILPPPEYNDEEIYRPIRVNRYTRNNTLVIFGELYWGSEWLFTYQFAGLSEEERNKLANFIHYNVGRRIRVYDHTGVQRIGIMTEPLSTTEDNPGQFSLQFNFQQIYETAP